MKTAAFRRLEVDCLHARNCGLPADLANAASGETRDWQAVAAITNLQPGNWIRLRSVLQATVEGLSGYRPYIARQPARMGLEDSIHLGPTNEQFLSQYFVTTWNSSQLLTVAARVGLTCSKGKPTIPRYEQSSLSLAFECNGPGRFCSRQLGRSYWSSVGHFQCGRAGS